MKYALYPGCTVLGRGRNYEMATREVARVLDIEFVDLDDFECCGFSIRSVHYETFMMMGARNILAAEEKGLDICTLCSACTGSLTEVNKHFIEHFDEKTRIIAQLKRNGINYRMGRNIAIKHFTKVLYENIGINEIEKQVKKKLSNLNIAAHYGCHYLKPTDIYINPEDPENPHSLDELIRVTGANSVDYDEKMKCCGAGVLAINEDLAYSIVRPKLQELSGIPHASPVSSTEQALLNKGGGIKPGVDAMVLHCPFCSVMYDDNQKKIEQKFDEKYNLPVLYYPQLLGLALGIDAKLLGLRMNRVSTRALLEKIGT
ncbi:8-methylmenaquinol:fumarate reductase membrane anchor subunit [subsurface metagenome]